MVRYNGGMHQAHRLFYELLKAPIQKELLACHKCDTRLCVNPDHIFIGTHYDNSHDSIKKGRWPEGESSSSSKLTERQILEISESKERRTILAKKFGVSKQHISKIRRGDAWKHIIRNTGFNEQRKLAEEQVRYILSSSETQRVLAEKFGVTQTAISLIKRRINWSWISI